MTSFMVWTTTASGLCVPQFHTPPPQPAVNVGPGGIEFPLYSVADFNNAKTTLRGLAGGGPTGGHVLRFKQTLTGVRIDARGALVSGGGNDLPAGVPGNHNTITRDPGVELVGVAGDLNNEGTLDVYGLKHWNVIGMKVRGGQFGIRCMALQGTAGSPCVVGWNEVSHTGHAHLAIQGWFASPWTRSTHIRATANNIHSPSPSVGASPFSEGIYIGRGSAPGWVDRTDNLHLDYNEIWDLPSDGIDLKPGITNFLIELNNLHDIALVSGGPIAGISLSYADVASSGAPPSDVTDLLGVVRWNRLWNITAPGGYTGPGYFNPIIVGFGGVEVAQNLMWGYNSAAAGIYLRSEQTFKTAPIDIWGNTMAGHGWYDDPANPGPARVFVDTNDNVKGLATYSGSYTHAGLTDFIGPITGTADHGEGPGSGFFLRNTSALADVGVHTTVLTTLCPDTPFPAGAMPVLIP
jgi:hypothetical protein